MVSLFTKSSVLSPKYIKKKRRRFIARVLFVLVLVAIIVGTFSFVLRLSSLRIERIEVTGNTAVTQKEIIDIAKADMVGSYYSLFPKDGVLFYPRDRIQNDIHDNLARIDNVSVETKNWNTLVIAVAERKPYALWCTGKPMDDNDCYFMDSTGFVYAKSPSFSGNVFFRYYGGDVVGAGGIIVLKNYIPAAEFSQINALIQSIQKLDITLVALDSLDDGEYEAWLKNGSDAAGYGRILFNNKDPYEKTLENLTTIWNEKIKNSLKASVPAIDYIDLRYGNKVYFKVQ